MKHKVLCILSREHHNADLETEEDTNVGVFFNIHKNYI
jgi:hypothetical protein